MRAGSRSRNVPRALALALLCGASVMATNTGTLSAELSVNLSPVALAAADAASGRYAQDQFGVGKIPRHRNSPTSLQTVEKYLPIGSSIDDADALIMALGCKSPLKLRVGEVPPPGYRRPLCTSMGIRVNSDKSQSVEALLELPGRYQQGHWLSIRAKADTKNQRIITLQATIDIRTLADL